MLNFLDLWNRKDLTRMIGEDKNVAELEVIGVYMRLDPGGALSEDIVLDVLVGLTICSTVAFRELFDMMLQNAILGNYRVLTTTTNSYLHIETINVISVKATDTYDLYATSEKWHVANKGGGAGAGVMACFNCDKGHNLPDYSVPHTTREDLSTKTTPIMV